MSLFGPATPASLQPVSGIKPAERKSRANAKPQPPSGVNRGSDEVDVSGVQSADAVRNLTSNGQEETADDRQEKDNFRPQQKKPPHPSLDVQG